MPWALGKSTPHLGTGLAANGLGTNGLVSNPVQTPVSPGYEKPEPPRPTPVPYTRYQTSTDHLDQKAYTPVQGYATPAQAPAGYAKPLGQLPAPTEDNNGYTRQFSPASGPKFPPTKITPRQIQTPSYSGATTLADKINGPQTEWTQESEPDDLVAHKEAPLQGQFNVPGLNRTFTVPEPGRPTSNPVYGHEDVQRYAQHLAEQEQAGGVTPEHFDRARKTLADAAAMHGHVPENHSLHPSIDPIELATPYGWMKATTMGRLGRGLGAAESKGIGYSAEGWRGMEASKGVMGSADDAVRAKMTPSGGLPPRPAPPEVPVPGPPPKAPTPGPTPGPIPAPTPPTPTGYAPSATANPSALAYSALPGVPPGVQTGIGAAKLLSGASSIQHAVQAPFRLLWPRAGQSRLGGAFSEANQAVLTGLVPGAAYTIADAARHGGQRPIEEIQKEHAENPHAAYLSLFGTPDSDTTKTILNKVTNPFRTAYNTLPWTDGKGLGNLARTAGKSYATLGEAVSNDPASTALRVGDAVSDIANRTSAADGSTDASNPVVAYEKLRNDYQDLHKQFWAKKIDLPTFKQKATEIRNAVAGLDYQPLTGHGRESLLDQAAARTNVDAWYANQATKPGLGAMAELTRDQAYRANVQGGLEPLREDSVTGRFPLPFPTMRDLQYADQNRTGITPGTGRKTLSAQDTINNYNRRVGEAQPAAFRNLDNALAGNVESFERQLAPGTDPGAFRDAQIARAALGGVGMGFGGLNSALGAGFSTSRPSVPAQQSDAVALTEEADEQGLGLPQRLGNRIARGWISDADRSRTIGEPWIGRGGPLDDLAEDVDSLPEARELTRKLPANSPDRYDLEADVDQINGSAAHLAGSVVGSALGNPLTNAAMAAGVGHGALEPYRVQDPATPPQAVGGGLGLLGAASLPEDGQEVPGGNQPDPNVGKPLPEVKENLTKTIQAVGGIGAALAMTRGAEPPPGFGTYWSQLDDTSKLLAIGGLSVAAISFLTSAFRDKDDDDEGFLMKVLPFLGIGAAAWGAGGGTFSEAPKMKHYKNLGNALGSTFDSAKASLGM